MTYSNQSTRRRCTGVKASGQPCKAWARRGDPYQRCASHPIEQPFVQQTTGTPPPIPAQATYPGNQQSGALWVGIVLGILVVLIAVGIKSVLVLGGFLAVLLGLIGLVRSKVPVLNIEGKSKSAVILLVGLCVWIIGAAATGTSPTPLPNIQSTTTSALQSPNPSGTGASNAPRVGNSDPPRSDSTAGQATKSPEHLALAKKALADGYKPKGKNRSWGNLSEARAHLEKITPADKEYLEAKKLLQEVARREAASEQASTEAQSGSQTGAPARLSNDNYYTNSEGNRVHSPAFSDTVPAGATAQCRDGSYSFSQNRRGTCSHHGGVRRWL